MAGRDARRAAGEGGLRGGFRRGRGSVFGSDANSRDFVLIPSHAFHTPRAARAPRSRRGGTLYPPHGRTDLGCNTQLSVHVSHFHGPTRCSLVSLCACSCSLLLHPSWQTRVPQPPTPKPSNPPTLQPSNLPTPHGGPPEHVPSQSPPRVLGSHRRSGPPSEGRPVRAAHRRPADLSRPALDGPVDSCTPPSSQSRGSSAA